MAVRVYSTYVPAVRLPDFKVAVTVNGLPKLSVAVALRTVCAAVALHPPAVGYFAPTQNVPVPVEELALYL